MDMQFFIKNKKYIIYAFWGLYVLLFGLYGAIGAGAVDESKWIELGHNFGTASVLVLSTVLLAGIIGRLELKSLISLRTLIMLFRRQLGILVFVLVFIHFGLVRGLASIQSGNGMYTPQFFFETLGFIAYVVFASMSFTSNNVSMKKLGKYWKYLHRLIYIASVLVIGHVIVGAGGLSPIALLLGLVLVTDAYSWVVFWKRNNKINRNTVSIIGVIIFVIICSAFGIFMDLNTKDQEEIASKTFYTMGDVANHSTANNCWMVIDNGVYDLTTFVSFHPGGDVIVEGCGTDATELFNSMSLNGDELVSRASSIIKEYKIGSLE